MQILEVGRQSALIMLLLIFIAIYYSINRAKSKLPVIKRIPALEALEEGVGRATEMGGNVLFIPGVEGLERQTAAETLAGLSVLRYVAEVCAKNRTKIIVAATFPEVIPLAEEIVRTAYTVEGEPEFFSADQIRYLASQQWGAAAGCMGIMQRENIVSNFMIGAFWGEALTLCESGAVAGCFQIGGCATNTTQMPWFVTICDYSLIGEEVYAAGAYLSKDQVVLGSLVGQDFGKLLSIVLIIIGFLLYLVGFTGIVDILQL